MVTVRWYGQSCFEFREGGQTIVVDPHDGKSIGLPPPRARADIVLKTHDHFDHSCVRQVAGPGTSVYEGGPPFKHGLFQARSVEAHHDGEQGAKLGKVQMMMFEVGGVRFCHLSDVGHPLTDEQAEAIGKPDVLFVPTGGIFTIDAAEAWRAIERLSPRVAVPMHYRFGGLSVSVQDLKPFLDRVPPGTEVVRVGNEMDVEGREDLPEESSLWVFSV
jgi:L-ascorbate metabolism protein UlaG (beta-lactamase superfamily)